MIINRDHFNDNDHDHVSQGTCQEENKAVVQLFGGVLQPDELLPPILFADNFHNHEDGEDGDDNDNDELLR